MNILRTNQFNGNHFALRQTTAAGSPNQQTTNLSGSRYDENTLEYLALLDLIATLKALGTPAGNVSAARLEKLLNAMRGMK